MTRYQQRRFICPYASCFGSPPSSRRSLLYPTTRKPPPAVPEGAFSVILRCSPCWVSALRLLGNGADAGLVVAGAAYAVLVDAAHRVGVLHARLGGLMVPVAVVVSTVPCNRKLVLVGELKLFLSPDLNIDIIPVCSLLKGRLLVELSGRALIPLPARSQPAAGTR